MKLLGVKILSSYFVDLILQRLRKENKYINKDFWIENKRRLEKIKERDVSSLNKMLYEYMTKSSLKVLLKYEDRNSMRFSIEARTPFADDINLIEYVFQIPSVYKIHNGWSKFLLRQAMKGILPEEIRLRKDKIGFATPEYFWLVKIKNELKEYFTDDLKNYINVDVFLKDWDNLFERQNKYGVTYIWRFINLAVWNKVYKIL